MTSNNIYLNRLIMYHEIHRLKREHLTISQINRYLVIDRKTVKKYLAMDQQKFDAYMEKLLKRKRYLDKYEDFIKNKLGKYADSSSAQVHDWLKEHYSELKNISERTVHNYVLWIREKYHIPKLKPDQRDYQQVEALPYGKQAQVDFGEFYMRTSEDKRVKIYFLSMVLSRSRYKYVYFQNRPFSAKDAIQAHENAFEYFEGMPKQVVYDQDKVFLVDENKGNLLLTEQFNRYVKSRGFKTHFCRKADPESKGKIESVVKYVKYNFLRNRIYTNVDHLNQQVVDWLERTANKKTHASTKQVPYLEWQVEKDYLAPYSPLHLQGDETLAEYTVRKDNTISFRGNFYGLPPCTYQGKGTKVMVKQDNGRLIVVDMQKNKIANYKICLEKGKLITNTNYRRDYSQSLNELISKVAGMFPENEKAKQWLQTIREKMPRYARDQIGLISKHIQDAPPDLLTGALILCIENKIYQATDFVSILKKLKENAHTPCNDHLPARPLSTNARTNDMEPGKRSIESYNRILDNLD